MLSKLTSTTYNATFSGVNNCSVYYTLNGANPTTSSTKYTKAFVYDTSKTLKYFAVKANGEYGAVLSMKLSEGSTPYIVYKTPITNQAQQVYISYTLPTTSIYYTINGSIPTTKSTKYNAPININNYTDLRFISVYGSITSKVYSYRMNAVKPVVTIKNITDVRDNYQNITVKINKAGSIYYTRNGSIPNTSSNTWTNSTKVMISIKTQVRAILVDNEGFTSDVTFYQPEKVITPPITAIRPLTTLENNKQRIQFSTNKLNCTVYYTTDGTNPNNSTTVKTAKNNDKIYLNKNTRLKYYTQDDIQLYKSKVFNYTPVQHPNERPTITIINASNIWSNGQQKIIIQSNQPGKFNITKYNQTQAPTETLNNYGSYTTDTNTKIEIYTQYGDKYSKTIEYNPINGFKTVMRYNYTVNFSNISQYDYIFFTVGNTEYKYHMYNNNLNNYIFLSFSNYTVTTNAEDFPNVEGCTIHKSDVLSVKFHVKEYGEINYINVIFKSFTSKYESIILYSNDSRLCMITLQKKRIKKEQIETIFQTNSNTFIKNETLTFKPREVFGCGQYDVLQTYLLTNQAMTTEYANQSINYFKNRDPNLDLSRITPQDRTILTAIMTLWQYDQYANYLTYVYNLTATRSDETLIITGINYDRINYIQFNDLKMGLVTTGNTSNKYLFNMQSTARLPEIARISLNLIKENIGKTAQSILMNLNENTKIIATLNNQTNTMKIYSENLLDIYLLKYDDTGIIECIIILDGFKYNGAISEPIIDDNNTENNEKNIKKSSTMGCYEDNCNENMQNNAHSLLGFATDSGWAIIEDAVGGFIADACICIAIGVISVEASPVVLGMGLVSGIGIMADSHGLFSGQATSEDWLSFGVDLFMLGISPVVSYGISTLVRGGFNRIAVGQTIELTSEETSKEIYYFITSIKETSIGLIEWARDEIVGYEIEEKIKTILGWYSV